VKAYKLCFIKLTIALQRLTVSFAFDCTAQQLHFSFKDLNIKGEKKQAVDIYNIMNRE
jgi:hypothetical protein